MTPTLIRPLQSQLPPGTQMDDLELQELIRSIQASPNRQYRVVRKQINRLSTEVSHRLQGAKGALISRYLGIPNIESIVAEAINNALLEAIKSIDRFDPNKAAFMTWINGILKFTFLDLLAKYGKSGSISLDDPICEDNPTSKAEIEANKKQEEEEEARTHDREMNDRAIELRKFIEKDPEGHLSSKHIRNRSDATFQKILLMRIDGLTWQQISDRLNIPVPTISSFHDRKLHQHNSYFRNNLCEY